MAKNFVLRMIYLILFLVFFLLFLLFIVFVVFLFFRKGTITTEKQKIPNVYRSFVVDPATNKTTVSFSEFFSDEEFVEFEDSSGKLHFFQNSESEEAVEILYCTGKCYCDEIQDENDDSERRGVFIKTAAGIVAGLTTIVGGYFLYDRKVKEDFRKKCKKIMEDVCDAAWIRPEVDNCEPIKENQVETDQQESEVQERAVCRGICMNSREIIQKFRQFRSKDEPYTWDVEGMNYDIDVADLDVKKLSNIDCSQLYLSSVLDEKALKSIKDSQVHDEYMNFHSEINEGLQEKPPKEDLGKPVSVFYRDAMDGIREIFVRGFLKDFCAVEGKQEIEVISGHRKGEIVEVYRCEAWGNQVHDPYGVSWRSNPSIDCVIE